MECPPPFALFPVDDSTPAAAPAPCNSRSTGSDISLALARAYWVAVVSAHSLTALFYYGYAAVYSRLHYSANTDAIVRTINETSVNAFYTPVLIVSSAIAIGHVIAVVNALLSSYRSRELVFSPDIWLDGPDKRAVLATAQLRNRDRWCVLRALFATYYKLKKRGLYVMQVCTLVEVVLQIFQASKLARLVASRAANRAMVAAVVLDCWHLPLVHFAFRKWREQSPAFEVLAQHVINSSLAIVYGLAIPAAIFVPYYHAFDASGDAFPARFYYRDTWAAAAMADSEQLFVSSWIDFAAKMAPGLALLYALRQMQTLLQVSPRSVASPQRHICIKLPTARATTTATAPAPDAIAPSMSAPAPMRVPPRGRIRHILDATLLCAGVVVLALHAHADTGVSRTQHADAACLLELRPWGTTQHTCAVLEVSCTKRAIAGESDEISAAIASVDPRAVRALIVSHCSALAVPPRIQSLPTLATLKLHNVTLTRWGDDAALTDTAHPQLVRVYISQTNMSALPRGLYARGFPSRMRDIQLCSTNLTALPTDLHEAWGSNTAAGLTLALEQSQGVVEVPDTLAKLPLQRLSLAGNGIRSVLAESLSSQALTELLLGGNPLQTLPSELGTLAQLASIDITDTNVVELPASWRSSSTRSSVEIRASGTPLCAALAQDTALDLAAIAIDSLRVNCVASGMTLYPLADEVRWRAAAAPQ